MAETARQALTVGVRGASRKWVRAGSAEEESRPKAAFCNWRWWLASVGALVSRVHLPAGVLGLTANPKANRPEDQQCETALGSDAAQVQVHGFPPRTLGPRLRAFKAFPVRAGESPRDFRSALRLEARSCVGRSGTPGRAATPRGSCNGKAPHRFISYKKCDYAEKSIRSGSVGGAERSVRWSRVARQNHIAEVVMV